MKVFLDTNIVFDFLLDSRGEFHQPAVDLLLLASKGTIDAGFSTSQSTDIYYSLRKVAGDKSARDALQKLYAVCSLMETPASACLDALNSAIEDYEDAVQEQTAKSHSCDFIITRNVKDFAQSDVPALNASDFIAMMNHTS